MKKEIEREIKILNINGPELEQRIYELGGTLVLDSMTSMEWFDAMSSTLNIVQMKKKAESEVLHYACSLIQEKGVSLKDSGMLLRLRDQNSTFDFTLKNNLSSSGPVTINNEFSETLTSTEAEEVRKKLSSLGFIKLAFHEKKRKSFLLEIGKEKVRIDLDTWPLIPQYAEIEGKNTEIIQRAISLLNLNDHETSNLVSHEFFSKYNLDFFDDQVFN